MGRATHSLGKGEVESSILSRSTIQAAETAALSQPTTPYSPAGIGRTEPEFPIRDGENPGSAFSARSDLDDREPIIWVNDGRHCLGHVYEAGCQFEAVMESGRSLGLFAAAAEAASAVSKAAAR